MRLVWHVLAGLLVLGALSVGVAACGGDDEGAQSGGGSAAAENGGANGASLAQAQERVEQLKAPTGSGEFPFPEESFDAGTGSAMVISTGDDCPVCAMAARRAVGVFRDIGWEVGEHRDGEFNPGVVGRHIQAAIREDVDGIVVISHNMSQNLNDLRQARDAGIAIGCVNCDISEEVEQLGITDASIDFLAEGEDMGWWLIANSEGAGNIFVADEPSRDPVIKRTRGTTRTLEEHCPDCEVQVETISVTEVPQPGPPTWRSALNANRDVTDAVGYFDGLAAPMARTAQSAGSDVEVSGYDADEAALALLRTSPNFVADFAIPYEYQTWSAVDQVLRAKAELEPWVSNDMPYRLLTKDNVETFTPDFAPEDDWKARFMEQWGKA